MDGRSAGGGIRPTPAREPGKAGDAQSVAGAFETPGRTSGVRPGDARAAAGLLGDARHGARRPDLAAADACVRPPRRSVEEVFQPAAGRYRVSETFQEY